MKRSWRAYHPGIETESGRELRLSDQEAHHIRSVLRLERGESIALFDGEGNEWLAEITACTAEAVEVRLVEQRADSVEAPVGIEIFQGLCRHDRMEWVIQKGTELGVAAIHPTACERAEMPGVKPRRLDRWRRIAIEAAKQSGRSVVPGIFPAARFPRPAAGRLPILLSTEQHATPLGDLLAEQAPGPAWIAVGPESGFSGEELSSLAAGGWRPAALGPRILRTETAGLAAAVIILHLWGDVGSRSG
jgi:16S rRNA (uracil1498-N3)-methyltransferase